MGGVERSETVEETYAWSHRQRRKRISRNDPPPAFGADPIFHDAGKKRPARTDIPREACVSFYLAHTAQINNWDLVDLSCYPLLGEWLLREAGKRDKTALEAFLNGSPGPRLATMPRTMLRYAIERFPEEERRLILASGRHSL